MPTADRPFKESPTAFLKSRIARYRAVIPTSSSDPAWVRDAHDVINRMLDELEQRGELGETPTNTTTDPEG
jgi:hypothetical protein